MTLAEIADAVEAEWYGAPQLRDFHNQPVRPRGSESENTHRTENSHGDQ